MDAQNFPLEELKTAIGQGEIERVKTLISSLSKTALNNLKDEMRITPLTYSIWIQNVDIVKLFIAQGIDVNQQAFGRTPLMHAVELGHKIIIQALLDAKADRSIIVESGETAVGIATKNGNTDIINFLNDYRPPASSYFNYEYWWPSTPLHRVSPVLEVKNKSLNRREEKKENPNDPDQLTPGEKLRGAAGRGDTEAVRTLIPHLTKFALNEANSSGYTALAVAAKQGHLEIVQLLIKANVDLNLQTSFGEGETPLMWAVIKNHVAIVEALLLAKARVDIKDFANKTVFTLAEEQNNPAILALLKPYAPQEPQSIVTTAVNYAYSWLPPMPTLTFLAPSNNNKSIEVLEVQNLPRESALKKKATIFKAV